jgi:hypothetical protein
MEYVLVISIWWMIANMAASVVSLGLPIHNPLQHYTIFSVLLWVMFTCCSAFVLGAGYILGVL